MSFGGIRGAGAWRREVRGIGRNGGGGLEESGGWIMSFGGIRGGGWMREVRGIRRNGRW